MRDYTKILVALHLKRINLDEAISQIEALFKEFKKDIRVFGSVIVTIDVNSLSPDVVEVLSKHKHMIDGLFKEE